MSNNKNKKLLQEVDRARKGEIITIPFRFDKLSRYIFLGKKLYHLIGGASGSGKSAWVDLNYVLNPAIWVKKYGEQAGIKLKVILRSMERSKEHRIAKWVCMNLYLEYGILIDVPSLLGWGVKKSKVTDEIYEKVVTSYEYIESLFDIIEVIDGIDNPTGVFNRIKRHAFENGTLYYYNEDGTFLKRNSKSKEPQRAHPNECVEASEFQPVYVPDDEDLVCIDIVDQLQAMRSERGFSMKQNLDKMSEYARISRDLYNRTPVIVNQMNRNIGDTYRQVKTELLPQEGDFIGSSGMYFDCDMAAILFNPYKYNLDSLSQWRINGCTNEYGINRFRSFHLLKNTYGPDNQIFGYQFIGENGIFRELPDPKSMNEEIYNSLKNPPNEQLITNYMKNK